MSFDDLVARARTQLGERKPEPPSSGLLNLGGPPVPVAGPLLPASRDPATMNLGMVAPTVAEVSALVEARRQRVRQVAGGAPSAWELLLKHDLLPLREYVRAVERHDALSKDHWTRQVAWETDREKAARMQPREAALVAFLEATRRGLPERYTAAFMGWLSYLMDRAPGFEAELNALFRAGTFPEKGRNYHSLIVAASGSGKSELLKAIIYHYVAHPTSAVVVLDPGGDMAAQLARWPELVLSDRLVYVRPELAPGKLVGINPLDGRGLGRLERARLAQIVTIAIGDSIDDLTPAMKLLLRHCCNVVVGVPGGDLSDVRRLLLQPNPPRGSRGGEVTLSAADMARREVLLAAAKSHEYPAVREFFEQRFESAALAGTRDYLLIRLDTVTAFPTIGQTLVGRPTLDLEAAIEARKVIVVNLKEFGSRDERAAFGRILVAMIAGIGGRRGDRRVPTQLIVDEAQSMVSEQMVVILTELRRYGVHMTLAQQNEGHGFTGEQAEVMLRNTGTKIISLRDRKIGAALMEIDDPDSLPKLETGQFWVRWHNEHEARMLSVRSDLADGTHTVTDAQWREFEARTLRTYYRDAEEAPRASQTAARGVSDDEAGNASPDNSELPKAASQSAQKERKRRQARSILGLKPNPAPK